MTSNADGLAIGGAFAQDSNDNLLLVNADIDAADAARIAAELAQTNAETAETNAETAEFNAGGHATTAANSLATFIGQYVSQAVEPTSPDEGDLWFDEANNKMKVYDGSGFINASGAVNGIDNSVQHTATADQEIFTATYDVGHLQVFLNGIRLDAADYTATNGSTVELVAGATLNDVVFIHSFGVFALADHYNRAESDALYASIAATNSALPKSGGAMTGAITTNSTFDGRNVAADGVLATNALPKSGGAMTGAITTNSTFDGRDVAADGTKLDNVATPVITGTSVTATNASNHVVSAGGITITLPVNPSVGNYVIIKDGTGVAAATPFTVARNGSNIASAATDLTFDKNFAEVVMTYVNSTIGWSI